MEVQVSCKLGEVEDDHDYGRECKHGGDCEGANKSERSSYPKYCSPLLCMLCCAVKAEMTEIHTSCSRVSSPIAHLNPPLRQLFNYPSSPTSSSPLIVPYT